MDSPAEVEMPKASAGPAASRGKSSSRRERDRDREHDSEHDLEPDNDADSVESLASENDESLEDDRAARG